MPYKSYAQPPVTVAKPAGLGTATYKVTNEGCVQRKRSATCFQLAPTQAFVQIGTIHWFLHHAPRMCHSAGYNAEKFVGYNNKVGLRMSCTDENPCRMYHDGSKGLQTPPRNKRYGLPSHNERACAQTFKTPVPMLRCVRIRRTFVGKRCTLLHVLLTWPFQPHPEESTLTRVYKSL